MEVRVKKLPKSKIELEIELSAKEFNDFIEQATLNLEKDLEMEGFRKGKVPKEIIEKKIGKEKILVQAADLAIKESYKKAVLENKIEAVAQPEIDILKLAAGNPFVFRAKISVLPEIKLPDYRKIASEIKKKKIFVEEKEINDTMKWFQKSRAKFIFKNGPAQIGDFIEIEYWMSQISAHSQNFGAMGAQNEAFILGEGHFISGFEEKLIGMREGEEKEEIRLTVPEDYHLKNLAGKNIDLKVKMKSVQNVKLPEINDQFAKSLAQFENLAALKASIKEGLNLEKEEAESQRIRREILEKISKVTEFEIPEILIEKEQNMMMENFRQEVLKKLNIPFKDYLSKIKKTEKEIFDSFLIEAKKRVEKFLILREISKREKIEVLEEEARKRTNQILKVFSRAKETPKELDPERLKEYTKEVLRNEKTLAMLEGLTRKS